MPSAADVTACTRCGASILWTITAATGARMPVDTEPNERGNTAVRADVTGTLRSRALASDRASLEGGEWRAMPHAATCTSPPPRRPRLPSRPVRRRTWRPR